MNAGRTTVTTVGTTVFVGSGTNDGATSFYVCAQSDSSFGCLVNIPGLHNADEFLPIGVGKELVFRHGDLGIKQVTVKGDGGDAIVVFGIISKTY